MTTPNNLTTMKNKALVLMLVAATVIAAGCGRKNTTSAQLDSVQARATDVAQDVQDYSFAEKNEFVAKMRVELADLNRDLDELAAKVRSSSAAVKADAQPRIDALRGQTAHLNQQLDEATNATAPRWDQFKAEVRKAHEASKQDFKQARQWLSDKIAP